MQRFLHESGGSKSSDPPPGQATTFVAHGTRAFYELGPGRTITQLARAIERLATRGLLDVDDPARAASDFNWLVMSEPLNRAMLLGDNGSPNRAATCKWADHGVRTFLAAYGPRTSGGRRRT